MATQSDQPVLIDEPATISQPAALSLYAKVAFCSPEQAEANKAARGLAPFSPLQNSNLETQSGSRLRTLTTSHLRNL